MKFSIVLLAAFFFLACQLADANKPEGAGGKKPEGGSGKPEGGSGKPEGGKPEKTEKEKKKDEKRNEIKEKFSKGKKTSQRDRKIGNSVMRCDKKGGMLAIQRKGIVFETMIKDIITRDENGTEVSKIDIKAVNFNITKDKNDSSTYGIQAAFVQLFGNLPNGGNITLQVFMFKDAGNVTGEDGNEYELVDGGVKFNLKIDLAESVKMLDVVLGARCGFKGESSKRAKKNQKARGRKGKGKGAGRRNLETFAVCENAQMTFSPAYNVSDKDVDMPAEFPKSNALSGENEAEIVLRFQDGSKFFYDPTAETGDDIGDPVDYDTGSSGTMATSSVLVLSCLIMLVNMLM